MSLLNYYQQIVSKYFTNYKDYGVLFSKSQHINKLYHTTFNYLFLDARFMLSKNETKYFINLIKQKFPNVETIELNFNVRYIISTSEIKNIIKIYKLFRKIDRKHKFKINIYKNISKFAPKYELNKTNLENKLYITSDNRRFTTSEIKIINTFHKMIELKIISNISQNNISILMSLIFTINGENEEDIDLLQNQPYKIICNIVSYTFSRNLLNNVDPKYIGNNKIYFTYDELRINHNPILFNTPAEENEYLRFHMRHDFLLTHINIIRLFKDNALKLLKEQKNDTIIIGIKNMNNFNVNMRFKTIKTYNLMRNDYNDIIFIDLRTIEINGNIINIKLYKHEHKIKFTTNDNINKYIRFIMKLNSKFNLYKYYN